MDRLLALLLYAQVSATHTLTNPPSPSIVERLTIAGHYTMTFDDPSGTWRCFLTSNEPIPGTATIVCAIPHAIPTN